MTNKTPMRCGRNGKDAEFRKELRETKTVEPVNSGAYASSWNLATNIHNGRRVPRKPNLDELERSMR